MYLEDLKFTVLQLHNVENSFSHFKHREKKFPFQLWPIMQSFHFATTLPALLFSSTRISLLTSPIY